MVARGSVKRRAARTAAQTSADLRVRGATTRSRSERKTAWRRGTHPGRLVYAAPMGVLLLLALSVTVRAEQPRLVLSGAARVTLQISAAGAGPDARLEAWVSAGRVVDVQRVSPERFSAVYVPPPQRYPQVAMILATVRDGAKTERGWLALPLVASEKLPVQTKPSSRVELWIGGAVFGPVRTDAAGKARIPAKIPPGVRTAVIRVRDPFGNVNETAFDLRPPPFPRVRLLALRDRASWADPDPVALEIFAVTPDGRPAPAADVSVVVDRGSLGTLQERAPGVFATAFRAPDRAAGPATIRAHVSGDPGGATVTVATLPGPAANIRLTAAPVSIAGAGEVRIGAQVVDGRGNPVAADELRFSVEGATLEQNGAEAIVQVPADHAGRRELVVSATAAAVRGSIAIALREPAGQESLEIASEARDSAIAVGALVGGQSNLSRANAGSMQAEVSVHPGLRGIELVARGSLLQFVPARAVITGVPEKGELRGVSIAAGARGSLKLRGGFSAHASVLVGALRSYGTLAIDGGPAAGVTQGTAQWGPLLAAAAGVSLWLGRGRVIAELQLSHAPARGDVSGNLGGVGVSFGYLFALR